ncbi:MAG: hypothetical protein WKG07_08440 [Hymenobacter sp.]
MGNVRRDTLNLRFPVPTAVSKKAAPLASTTLVGGPRSAYRQGQPKFRFPAPVRLLAGKGPAPSPKNSARNPAPCACPPRSPPQPQPHRTRQQTWTPRPEKRGNPQLDGTALLAITGQSLGLRATPCAYPWWTRTRAACSWARFKRSIRASTCSCQDDKYQVLAQLRSPAAAAASTCLPHTANTFCACSLTRMATAAGAVATPTWKIPAEPSVPRPREDMLQIRAGFEINRGPAGF